METAQLASSPQHSSTVMAAAGTGKTWLLVTRLVRLLLAGTSPDSILAITFTRKAAAEMAARLMDRLYSLARMDDGALEQALREMGIDPTTSLLHKAGGLYEQHLFQPRQARVTTFHAFSQELLHRFPLEADVPAGFEVLDGARLIQEEAWDALVDEVTRFPNSQVAQSMEDLFQHLSGHQATQTALMRFLHHRSDWWAFTLGEPAPVEHATQTLATLLSVDSTRDPLMEGLTISVRAELQEYAAMLIRHGTDTFIERCVSIENALSQTSEQTDRTESINRLESDSAERLNALRSALLKRDGRPLALKPSKAMAKSLGEDGQRRFLALHEQLASWLMAIQDQYRRRQTLSLSQAWFRAGARLLDHYQRIKTERRMLDFSDLEWKAFLLLNHADHALWVQYKLDQRIDHLLIDEFQDTNPTQWHLIFPLLQELAAASEERWRTVFLVGDAKQSIYRFRRAEPALFPAAQQWLREQLHAVDHALSASWRSSPAVIDFVNRVFANGHFRERLSEFHPHTTYRTALWGQVEVLPLIVAEDAENSSAAELRNPLHRPRLLPKDQRHRQEGEMIAARILSLLAEQTVLGQGAEAHPARYDDIMILVRNRTHVRDYEDALRAAAIPYVTASRGTLLDCIEISDMVALLEILIIPYNNLTLATVLRSPLFDCSDEDLMMLAAVPGGNWLERLLAIAPQFASGTPLARAAHWLPRWQIIAGQRPVHDLLDRIYCEGNVLARYEAAFPAHLRPRIRANLTRFLELALEMDSGRYPSLTAFLERLRTLKVLEDDAPDEAAESVAAGNVRLLTIHAAKGLEAPVIFLADAAAASPAARAYQAVVRWPAHADRPSHFLLCGKPSETDTVTAALLDHEAQQDQREQANLLYVALTRAKQLLFISGSKPKRGEELGWYGAIAAQLGEVEAIAQNGWTSSAGAPPPFQPTGVLAAATTTIDPRFAHPIPLAAHDIEIAPSRADVERGEMPSDEDGRERGLAIHRFLQLLSGSRQFDLALMRRRVVSELNLDENIHPVAEWQAEAETIVQHPDFRPWFDANLYDNAFNEVPIYYYQSSEKVVQGVIDRLVVKNDGCILIDYKTHRGATADNLAAMAAPYGEQMRLYTEGVKRLWPGKSVRAYLLFTACAGAYEWREEPRP